MIQDLLHDLRFTLRSLRRRPLFTLIAISTLGIGIGGMTAIFSVVNGVLLKDLPYRNAEQLLSIWKVYPPGGSVPAGDQVQYTYDDYLALRDGTKLLQDVAVYAGFESAALTGTGTPERLSVGEGSANLFEVVGVRPILGREFLPGEEGSPGTPASRVAVLSYELWQRKFGRDPSVIGRSIQLDGQPFAVVGVLPRGFALESFVVTEVMDGAQDDGLRDVWVPIGQAGSDPRASGNAFEVFGRAAPGVSIAQAQAEARMLLPLGSGPADQEIRMEPRKQVVTGSVDTPLLLILGAAGLLLLIACANVAGLLLGESSVRNGEMAVRSALGAGRVRVVRQLLTESVALGLLGSALGIVLAWWGTRILVTLAPPIPRVGTVEVSGTVLLFAVMAGLLTGLLFGLAPVTSLLRRSVGQALRSHGRGMNGEHRHAQGWIASLQVSLTVVLLVAGGLMARSLMKLMSVDPGFDTKNLATFKVDLPESRYPTVAAASAFFHQVIRNVEAVPGVESASGSYGLPFPGGSPRNPVQVAGTEKVLVGRRRTVMASYHQTMGIRLLEGRYLSATDTAGADGAMVVSASLAAALWPQGGAVGTTVQFFGQPWTVVGVVADVRHTNLSQAGEPTFYVPFAQAPRRNLTLVARTESDAASLLPALRQAVWAVDPDIPVTDAETMTGLVSRSTQADRYRTLLILVFGSLAAVLASVGVFGLTARRVAQRTREIGIRMALGAGPKGLVRAVLRRSLIDALVGTGIGLVGAFWVRHLLSAYLFGVESADPVTYLLVGTLVVVVCAVAAGVPAVRAARVSPMSVMRQE
jgi:putative ABC transport system permease protein